MQKEFYDFSKHFLRLFPCKHLNANYSFIHSFFFIAIMGNVTTLERSSLQKQMINEKKAKQVLNIFIRRRTKCIVQLELHDFFPIVSFQLGLFSSQLVNHILPVVRSRSVAC